MTAMYTPWDAPAGWLLVTAAVIGLAAGGCIRHAVAAFSPRTGPGQRSPGGPRKTVPALFELATGALFVVTAWRFGPVPQLPAYLFFAAIGIVLGAIDLRHRILPNAVVLPGIGITALLLTAAAAVQTQWDSLIRAGIGGLLLFTLYLILALINPRGMGMGDVKLAALVGLVLSFQSWQTLFTGTFLGFLIGAAVSVLVLTTRRGVLKTSIPFGPAILTGTLAALLLK